MDRRTGRRMKWFGGSSGLAGWLAAVGWLGWAGAALVGAAVVGCREAPAPLGPGECRTDTDCPGRLRCHTDGRAPIGVCGCVTDLDCPGVQTCVDHACGCTEDTQCPAGLVCDRAEEPEGLGVCRCETDAMCAGLPCADGDDCPGDWACVDGACRPADGEPWPACVCADGVCALPERIGAPAGPDQAPTCDLAARSASNDCGGRQATRVGACDPESGECAPAEVGDVCGEGGWGQWSCTGCDTPLRCCRRGAAARLGLGECCDPRAGLFACDALADPTAPVETPEGEALCCPPDHLLDACGACVEPGDPLFDVLAQAPAAIGDVCVVAGVPGVWRCETDEAGRRRLGCAECPLGDDGLPIESPCGGCGLPVLQGALDPELDREEAAARITREAVTRGDDCGGPARAFGFISDCGGRLDCADAFTVRCLERRAQRCPGVCDAVAAPLSVDALRAAELPVDEDGTRYCLLDGDDPETACRSVSELAGAATPAEPRDGAPGQAVDLSSITAGSPCGVCGTGRWACDGEGLPGYTRLRCVGEQADSLNICGVCGGPPVRAADVQLVDETLRGCREPGSPGAGECPCIIDVDPPRQGVLDCDSTGTVQVCTERFSNPCGGSERLEPEGAVPGAPCAGTDPVTCPGWVWACADADRLICVNPRISRDQPATRNDCGGCAPIPDRDRFPRARCQELTERDPVCRADRMARVCIIHDDEAPGGRDGDGRCHCGTLANGQLVLSDEECLYLPAPNVEREARCDDDDPLVASCGRRGQLCCPPNGQPRCQDGLVCADDQIFGDERCVSCGGAWQPCCGSDGAEGTCNAGQVCDGVDRICRPCGGPDQRCCGGACEADHACDGDDRCRPCGAAGELCCDGGARCDPVDEAGGRLGCFESGDEDRCGACGALDGRCCDGGQPCGGPAGPRMRCGATVQDRCGVCGGADDPCCDGDACDAGYACSDRGNRRVCAPCGGPDEPCCAGDACDPDHVCRAGGFQPDRCVPCGRQDEPCCAGDACEAGQICGLFGDCTPCGQSLEPCCEPPQQACQAGACGLLQLCP